MSRRPACLERLDDHHRRAAAGTRVRGLFGCDGRCGRGIGVCRLRCGSLHRRRRRDQVACVFERRRLAAAAGEQAVVADTVEALGQDVQHEAADVASG